MWIMIAGPYTTGAGTDKERARNLSILNAAALMVFDKGHIPIIGVNLALPIIQQTDTGRFDDIMMPVSIALASRCDACLRIGGPSVGADEELESFRNRGLPVYTDITDVPMHKPVSAHPSYSQSSAAY